jgi:hypothetical protein
LSSPFPLPGDTSPSADVATPPRHVTLPFHGAKMSLLSPLNLLATLRPVVSPLEPKPKHYICTNAAGHPPRTARLPPFTAIKKVISAFTTLPITQSRLYFTFSLERAFYYRSSTHRSRSLYCRPMPIVPPHNDTHGDKLADPLLLPEQLIDI